MKKIRIAPILVALCVLVITLHAAESKLAVGMSVAAEYDNGIWYTGTISAIKGKNFDITFYDNATTTTTEDKIRPLSKNIKLKIGERVLAIWDGNEFYVGIVKKVNKDNALIAWADGTEASEVALDKIVNNVDNVKEQAAALTEYPIRKNGSIVGSIDTDGNVRMNSSMVGKFDSNGDVRVGSSIAGRLDSNGDIRKGSSIVGRIDDDGTVRKGSSIIGKIDDDGTVREGSSIIGSAEDIDKAQAAAFFFFFFLGE